MPYTCTMDTIEIYESRKVKGQFGWRYKAKNGKKIATCGELYKSRKHAGRMVSYLFGDIIIAEHAKVKHLNSRGREIKK